MFEMGHFAIIAAYTSGSALEPSDPLASAAADPRTSVGQGEMVLVMDVWMQACDAYWVPLEKAWAAMCTGKDEAWGSGHVSKLSRGFLVVSRPSVPTAPFRQLGLPPHHRSMDARRYRCARPR